MIRKIITSLAMTLSVPVMAQINLELERNIDLQKREVIENSPQNINSEIKQEPSSVSENLQPSSIEAQKAKFANMSQFLLMNAAVVGYGQACGFQKDAVREIKEFAIKRYEIKNEKYILDRYEEKINEFLNSKPKEDECNIFRKEFNNILSKVREFK